MYVDCHNDTILKIIHGGSDFSKGSPDLHVDLPKILSVPELGALFFAAWCDPVYKGSDALSNSLLLLQRIKELADRNPDHLEIALHGTDIDAISRSGKVAILLAVEGGLPIESDIRNLHRLYDEGVRLITFCHLVSPAWAGGCHDKDQRGLRGFGFDVVRTMNEMGMIIDAAHASEQSILDIAAESNAPILSSHSCVKGVFDTERALSDEALRAIAGTGGAIGIMFFPGVLAPRPPGEDDPIEKIRGLFSEIDRDDGRTADERARRKSELIYKEYPRPSALPSLEAVFLHIDYVVNLVGDVHVAIGSDFDGIPYSCTGLEHIGKIDALAGLMRRRGYSEDRITRIMGGNALRIIKAVLR